MVQRSAMDYYSNAEKQRTVNQYDREKVLQYAHKWAYARNPAYLDFEKIGGDCTNFASQCIFAGSGIMNYTPVFGWYYAGAFNRTASWTGVNYLFNFLFDNKGSGPFAEEVDSSDAGPGDIAQVSFSDAVRFDHSPVIVKVEKSLGRDGILVAAHTFDTDYYKLMEFEPAYVRYLHIIGVRI